MFHRVTFLMCASSWACSGSESPPAAVATDVPSTMPAEPSAGPTTAVPDTGGADDDAGAGVLDGAASKGGDAEPDAGVDASPVGCADETEPNDGAPQQMPRSLCGKLTAADVDRFYMEGRQDEPIEVTFSADGDARVTFATTAGLSEAYFGKSFKTTVKPGARKLFVDVGLASGPIAYHVAFERK